MDIKIKKLLPGVKKNISLKNFTAFKIGGRAKYFYVAKTKEDLIKAISAAKKNHLPFFILGGGSNLLVSDKGFNGLVIKIQNPKFKFQIKSKNRKAKIYVEAGMPLALAVSEAVKNNLSGLEWATGIPGTAGGAIYGNAGAFGKSMADAVKSVEVLEVKNQSTQMNLSARPSPKVLGSGLKCKVKNLKNKNCKFGYKESVFKKDKNLIVLSAELGLQKKRKTEIKKKMKEFLEYRKRTQPLNFPSAGSVFKNPALGRSKTRGKLLNFSAGRLKGGEPRSFGAGEMIERSGLKGKRMGNVKISDKHANFIVNLGNGRAKDVKKLIKLAKKQVKKKFKKVLEEEIQYLGF